MSALDGWIDVCRTGTWIDAKSREVEVTESDFDQLVANYAGQDPAPVVVGHPEMDAPAYAWVSNLRRVGDRLQAQLRDIMPEFRAAVEGGRYAGRSIAFTSGVLHHLGFLGGRAPAVPGLAPTRFTGPAETVIALAASDLTTRDGVRYIARAVARLLRGLRETTIDQDGMDAADRSFPAWDIDHLNSIAEDLDDKNDAAVMGSTKPDSEEEIDMALSPTPKSAPTPALDDTALAARAAELDAREARIAQSELAAQTTARLAECDRLLEPHILAGRILPAERPALAALLAAQPEGDEGRITFASGDGDSETQEQPRAVLERLFAAIPPRLEYNELSGGAVPPVPESGGTAVDSATIAAEARALMSEAESRGEIITSIEAVDRARAKRGIKSGENQNG